MSSAGTANYLSLHEFLHRTRSWNEHFACGDFHRKVSVALLAQQLHLVPNFSHRSGRVLCREVADPTEYLDQTNIVVVLFDSQAYVGMAHYHMFIFIDFPGMFDKSL